MSDPVLTRPVPVAPQQRRPAEAPSPDVALALLQAADDDADALADRLHDGALQALVVARYATDAAIRGGDPALARDAVQEALVALRRTVWMLRPRGGEDLLDALGELAKRRVAAGLPTLDLDLDPATAAGLSPAARTAAYRFVQAATADAAGAVTLGTVTQGAGAYAVLSVAGPGLDDPAPWTARAQALGGRLDRACDPACLRLPLNPTSSDLEGDR